MALLALLGERGGAFDGGVGGDGLPAFGDGGGPFGSRTGTLGLGASLRSLVGTSAKLPPIKPAWDLQRPDRLEESPAAAPRRLLGQPIPLAEAGDSLLAGPSLRAGRREDFFGALDFFGGPGGAAASTEVGPAGQVAAAGDGAAERANGTPGVFRLQDSPELDGQFSETAAAIAEAMEARREASAMASAMQSSSAPFGARASAALAQAEHASEGSRSHAEGHFVAAPFPDPAADRPGEGTWLHPEGPAVSAAPQSAVAALGEATDAAKAGLPEPVATVVPPQVRARAEMRKLLSSSLDARPSSQGLDAAANQGEPIAGPAAVEPLRPRSTSSLSPAAATRLPKAALYTPGAPPPAAPALAATTVVAAPTAIMPLGSTAVVPAGYQITVAQDGAHVAPARIITASTPLGGAPAGGRLVTREEMARNGHCVEHGGAVANSELLRDRAAAAALLPPAGLPPAQLQPPAVALQPVAGMPPPWHPGCGAGMPPPIMQLPAGGLLPPGVPPPGMPGMQLPGMPPVPPQGGLLPPPPQQLPPGVSMVPMPPLSMPPGAAPPFLPPGVAPVPGVSFMPPGAGKPFTIVSAVPQGMPQPLLAEAAGHTHEEHEAAAQLVEAQEGSSAFAPAPQPELLPTFGLAQPAPPGGPPAAGSLGGVVRPGALPERHPPWQGCFPTLAPEVPPVAQQPPGGVLDASACGAAAQPRYKYGPNGEPLPAPMSSMDHVMDHAEQQYLASRTSLPPRGVSRPPPEAQIAPDVSQFVPASRGADAAAPAGGEAQQPPAPRAKRQADYGYGPSVQEAPAPLLPLGPPGGVAAGSGTSLGSPEPHGRVDSLDPSVMYV